MTRYKYKSRRKKSIEKFAFIGLDQCRMSLDEKEVLYKSRWRKIHVDAAGDPYVYGPGWTVWFEIKKY